MENMVYLFHCHVHKTVREEIISISTLLLQDFQMGKAGNCYLVMVAHLLTVASMWIASLWKTPDVPSVEHWKEKARYTFLVAKLSTAVRYSKSGHLEALRQFSKQWSSLFNILTITE